MKKYLFLVLVFSATVAMAQQDPKAKKILDDMSAMYKGLPGYKVNFVQKMENRTENINEQYSGEITVKGDKFKLVIGDQEVFNNGETVWTYFSDVNEVNIDNFIPEDGEMSPVTIYNGYEDGYKYQFVETKKSGAATLNVVELQPEKGSRQFEDLIKIKLEIDAATNTVSLMQIYDRVGTVFSYKLNGFTSQSGLSDAIFNFNVDKHPGVEVVDLR